MLLVDAALEDVLLDDELLLEEFDVVVTGVACGPFTVNPATFPVT